jgi:deazaflavin-dependent oxidoreductase (nitroreductase family)
MAASALARLGNTVVGAVLHSPLHVLLDRRTALLTITGRKSGRRFEVPVEYSRDGHVVYVISHAGDRWWRNLKGGARLTIRIGGVEYRAYGEVREMVEADRTRFLQGFWRETHGRYLDGSHASEIAREAVIVRILLTDD